MSKLIWDEVGERLYETGVSRGVLYPRNTAGKYPMGVPWNGLTGITESPSGAEPTPLYADDIKYLTLMSAEEFAATIEAFTYPNEFMLCDGSAELVAGIYVGQQSRQAFGLAYRTVVGNDIEMNEFGYKIHIIYGGVASPSEKAYSTISDSPEAITFSWDVATTPVNVPGFKPTATLTIDSTKVSADKMAVLEGVLYGSDGTPAIPEVPAVVEDLTADPPIIGSPGVPAIPAIPPSTARLPLPDEIVAIIGQG